MALGSFSSVVSQVDVRPVETVSKGFLAQLARDSDVADWLISVSEIEKTREDYLDCLARFLNWTGWTPMQIFSIKRDAMKQGEPTSQVETQIRRYHEGLRKMGYAGKTRAKMIAAICSFIASKGYTVPKKLVRLDASGMLQMRVPMREEVELFIQYAPNLEGKLCYTLMTESPCRPRVFPALRWNWLEPEWWVRDVVHVNLPRQFRPGPQGGPRKFEPVCFIGPKGLTLLKQLRDAKIKAGGPPLETDRILTRTYEAMLIATRRDFNALVTLGLIRPSQKDEKGNLTEQPITPKSWRKYQFNIIDALTDISPEWRKMLKGRDLQTERYYSRENVEALREIYRTKIYPQLWSDTSSLHESEKVKGLQERIEKLELVVHMLEDASNYKVIGDMRVKAVTPHEGR